MSHPGNEDKFKGLDPILPTVTFVGGFDRLVGSESKENLSQTRCNSPGTRSSCSRAGTEPLPLSMIPRLFLFTPC